MISLRRCEAWDGSCEASISCACSGFRLRAARGAADGEGARQAAIPHAENIASAAKRACYRKM